MNAARDRWLEAIRVKEKAEEDRYFTRRDRELLARLHEAHDEEERRSVQELACMRCPECGARLVRVRHRDVRVQECPQGHGMWLTESKMRTLARRERDSWIGRLLYRPRPVV